MIVEIDAVYALGKVLVLSNVQKPNAQLVIAIRSDRAPDKVGSCSALSSGELRVVSLVMIHAAIKLD